MYLIKQALIVVEKLKAAEFAQQADQLKTLMRYAYHLYDDRVVDFINEHGETSRGDSLEAIMWSAIQKGMPEVYKRVSQNIDFDAFLDFDTLWKIILDGLKKQD